MKRYGKFIACTLLTLAVLCVEFGFSAQTGESSASLSGRLTRFLMALVAPGCPETSLALAEHVLRKTAHFTLYALLGVGLYGMWEYQRLLPPVAASLLSGAVFAALDEWHQLFVSGRSGQWSDVLLDSCGVAFGCCLHWLIERRRRRRLTAQSQ